MPINSELVKELRVRSLDEEILSNYFFYKADVCPLKPNVVYDILSEKQDTGQWHVCFYFAYILDYRW